MKHLLFGFLLLVGVNSLQAQAKVSSKAYSLMLKNLLDHSVPELSAKQAATYQNTALFLDAREAHEYAVSHIKDARFVGYDDFEIDSVLDIPKSKKIIVYCSVGYRSEKVSEQLLAAGFKDVANLYGGIFEWKNSGYPVYKAHAETENVHAYDRVWGLWLKKGEKVYTKP